MTHTSTNMKNLFLICFLSISFASFAGSKTGVSQPVTAPAKIQGIDAQDTVFFDLTQAVVNGTTVEFPVFIKSDDPINSLDFSFKYNHLSWDYDTIFNLTAYIEMLSNYNTNDSTVYFTSYSFTQTYTNNVSLVKIRFNLNGGTFSGSDLSNVIAYLNGDVCTSVVVDVTTGLNDSPESVTFQVFPNPAVSEVFVSADVPVKTEIISQNGAVVSVSPAEMQIHCLKTENLAAGMYLIKVSSKNYSTVKSLIIKK